MIKAYALVLLATLVAACQGGNGSTLKEMGNQNQDLNCQERDFQVKKYEDLVKRAEADYRACGEVGAALFEQPTEFEPSETADDQAKPADASDGVDGSNAARPSDAWCKQTSDFIARTKADAQAMADTPCKSNDKAVLTDFPTCGPKGGCLDDDPRHPTTCSTCELRLASKEYNDVKVTCGTEYEAKAALETWCKSYPFACKTETPNIACYEAAKGTPDTATVGGSDSVLKNEDGSSMGFKYSAEVYIAGRGGEHEGRQMWNWTSNWEIALETPGNVSPTEMRGGVKVFTATTKYLCKMGRVESSGSDSETTAGFKVEAKDVFGAYDVEGKAGAVGGTTSSRSLEVTINAGWKTAAGKTPGDVRFDCDQWLKTAIQKGVDSGAIKLVEVPPNQKLGTHTFSDTYTIQYSSATFTQVARELKWQFEANGDISGSYSLRSGISYATYEFKIPKSHQQQYLSYAAIKAKLGNGPSDWDALEVIHEVELGGYGGADGSITKIWGPNNYVWPAQ